MITIRELEQALRFKLCLTRKQSKAVVALLREEGLIEKGPKRGIFGTIKAVLVGRK